MDRFVVLSGCSGGGKSALLAELRERGHAVVEEPGRRIVAQERRAGGRALPWVDPLAFAQRAIALALEDRERAVRTPGFVFFDRGLIDAAAALEFASGQPAICKFSQERYNSLVFFVPPWAEIYVRDRDRRHDFGVAISEFERLFVAYSSLGYTVEELPKSDVRSRADLVEEGLGWHKCAGPSGSRNERTKRGNSTLNVGFRLLVSRFGPHDRELSPVQRKIRLQKCHPARSGGVRQKIQVSCTVLD